MANQDSGNSSISNSSLARGPWQTPKESRAKYTAPYCPYECKICHKRFPTKQALGGHSNGHNQEKRFMSEYYRRHFEAPPQPPRAAAFFDFPGSGPTSVLPGAAPQFFFHPFRAAAEAHSSLPKLKTLFPLAATPLAVRSAHKLTAEFCESLAESCRGEPSEAAGGGREEDEEEAEAALDLRLNLW